VVLRLTTAATAEIIRLSSRRVTEDARTVKVGKLLVVWLRKMKGIKTNSKRVAVKFLMS
jgi:hypothetical protein